MAWFKNMETKLLAGYEWCNASPHRNVSNWKIHATSGKVCLSWQVDWLEKILKCTPLVSTPGDAGLGDAARPLVWSVCLNASCKTSLINVNFHSAPHSVGLLGSTWIENLSPGQLKTKQTQYLLDSEELAPGKEYSFIYFLKISYLLRQYILVHNISLFPPFGVKIPQWSD